MKKKLLCMTILFILICSGCRKKTQTLEYDENGANELIVSSPASSLVTGTKLVTSDDNKILKSKVVVNEPSDFDLIIIRIYDENDTLIKESTLQIDTKIYRGQTFLIDEEYNYEDGDPYKMEIEFKKIEVSDTDMNDTL